MTVLQPCNPAVGGPAKSQLVHEVDALGGEMGKMADKCYLQKRILNRSKVPVSQSLLYRCWYIGFSGHPKSSGAALLHGTAHSS